MPEILVTLFLIGGPYLGIAGLLEYGPRVLEWLRRRHENAQHPRCADADEDDRVDVWTFRGQERVNRWATLNDHERYSAVIRRPRRPDGSARA